MKLETVKLDDTSIAMLVVLFFGLGFAFGFGLSPVSNADEEMRCQQPQ